MSTKAGEGAEGSPSKCGLWTCKKVGVFSNTKYLILINTEIRQLSIPHMENSPCNTNVDHFQ